MKTLFTTLATAVIITIAISAKAAGGCPAPLNIHWVGPSCDTITVSLIFNMPCNGKCAEGQTSYPCQLTSTPTTIVTEGSDGTLTIPCCAKDIKLRVSGNGHTLEMEYEKSKTASANGVVVLIDEDGNMRVNAKGNPKTLASGSQF